MELIYAPSIYCCKNSEDLKFTDKEFKTEKRKAIKAAKELCYGPAVVEELKKATTPIAINNILKKARHSKRR